MVKKPHYDIVIATPGTAMEAEYVQSLVETTAHLNDLGLSYIFLNKHSSFVPTARELTATNSFVSNWDTNEIGGGEFTYGRLLWIDSDIVWTPQDIDALILADKDIISGVYLTNPATGVIAAHFPDENGLPTYIRQDEILLRDDLVEVGGVGFGFVMMKSGVFESVERPWFLVRRVKYPDVDFYTMVGEDYSFCAAAQKAGHKIWLHTGVRVGHIKRQILSVPKF